MTMQERLARATLMVKDFHKETGVLCTVSGLVWDDTHKVFLPPSQVKGVNIPFSIASLIRMRDPAVRSVVQSLNISFERYRMLTCPFGLVTFATNDRIAKQPVSRTSDVYIVVEAMAPDETSPLECILHCQLLG